MITLQEKGDFSKTMQYLRKIKKPVRTEMLKKYGEKGVRALSSKTPKDTGLTAASWNYRIKENKERIDIEFTNSNSNKGVLIALILQYGHGTNNGGWVEGIDYINPALKPIFEEMADEIWKEVTGG